MRRPTAERRAATAAAGLLMALGARGESLPPPTVAPLPVAPLTVAAAPQWGETLLLALRVNGVHQDGMVRAVRLREGLALPKPAWEELGLRVAAEPRLIDGELHLLLAQDGPWRWRIDEATQTLELDAPPAAFVGQRLALGAGLPQVTQPSAWAPFLNYDLQWQTRGGSRSADGLWELGLFGPLGDLSSSQLSRGSSGQRSQQVRLETRWQRDDTERLARLTVGDSISQGGSWGRALRFGGLQWATDFSLQPGFLSFPLPTLRGESALPSTLDVYVNNGQRLQSRLPAGPFDLAELPVVTGQGEIRTVVRDLLGREQVVVTPYYVSPQLLKPGLSAYSLELGAERRDYGQRSNRYGPGFASATHRLGLTETLSRELRAELSARRQVAGATALWLWPALGTFSGSAVLSRSREGGGGWLLAGGLDRQARDWSGSLQFTQATAGYTSLGQAQAPRSTLSAALGRAWGASALGLSWVQQRGGPQPARLAQLNFGQDLGRWGYLGVVALRDLHNGGSTLALSWTRALDERHSTGFSLQRQPPVSPGAAADLRLQAQVQRNPAFGEGLGWQLLAESGGRQFAQAQWQGDGGRLNGGVARYAGQTELRAGAAGGLAWLDGGVYSGRRVEGGIALVDVGGHADVPVLHDNQVVARTDARGRAFVTGLRGYQSNRLGIDASSLPLDAELEALEIRVTPAARSALQVRFPVQQGRSVSLRVVDAAGQPLPPATELRVAGHARSFPVGLAGRAYLAGLVDGPNQVLARGDGLDCRIDLVLPPATGDDLPDLGLLTCR